MSHSAYRLPRAGSAPARAIWVVLGFVTMFGLPVVGWFAGALAGAGIVYGLSPEDHSYLNAAIPLGGLAGLVLAILGWTRSMRVIHRYRIDYLRSTGTSVTGSVNLSRCEYLSNPRGPGSYVVHLHVRFEDPRSGVVYQVVRKYRFRQSRERSARAMQARLPLGTPVTVLLGRGGAVALDVPERPMWFYVW
ncbi:hypothetical protein GPX89_00030 [Nocardia sp. ET3-3]|uniref:DUF3592 domain-containing protein n=1 Tax=Nocardia terrae TaxID=2675851 RepID=A0A7K1UN91_9NOCA|nr:hypothetical protein [Nocardia terrae]MVU75629.1 hypothetical protein [Nocardia terrae]